MHPRSGLGVVIAILVGMRNVVPSAFTAAGNVAVARIHAGGSGHVRAWCAVYLQLDKLLHERNDGSPQECLFHEEECLGDSHQGLCSAGSAATSTTSTPTPSCATSAGTAASHAASTAAAPPPCWGFPPWGVPWTRGLPCQLSRKLPTLPTTRLRCCRRVSRELTPEPGPQNSSPVP